VDRPTDDNARGSVRLPRWLLPGVAGLVAVVTGGCATVFKGATDEATMVTSPPGAEVYVDAVYQGTTPLRVELDATREHTVMFRLAGYRDQVIEVPRRVGPEWIVLDILFAAVPLIVDAVTGDWYYVDDVETRLTPARPPVAGGSDPEAPSN